MTDRQVTTTKPASLLEKFAGKYGLEPAKMMTTLKATAFRQKGRNAQEITNEQMAALVVVADQYGLNPWTKEIYAYPDQGAIVPVVGVDGWSRIINDHPEFDGLSFAYAEELAPNEKKEHQDAPAWIECIIHRKDRSHPITVREYFDEVYRAPFKVGMKGPWQSHTRRMMRHKVLIQAARIAFGFTGIHDQDEAERIIEGKYEDVTQSQAAPVGDSKTDRIKSQLGIDSEPTIEEAALAASDESSEPENDRSEIENGDGDTIDVDPETGEVLPPELQG